MSDFHEFSQPSELSGIAKAMKITGGSWKQGEVSVQTTVSSEHTNKGGVAHGGLYSMMLDMALGGTLVSTLRVEEWCATTSLNVNFIDAAQVGDHLTATGRIVRRGRRPTSTLKRRPSTMAEPLRNHRRASQSHVRRPIRQPS